jgi:hypothetical protein
MIKLNDEQIDFGGRLSCLCHMFRMGYTIEILVNKATNNLLQMPIWTYIN